MLGLTRQAEGRAGSRFALCLCMSKHEETESGGFKERSLNGLVKIFQFDRVQQMN